MYYDVETLVREALAEDVGQGDATTNATVPQDARCRAELSAKSDGIMSGIRVFRLVFECLEAQVTGWRALNDGAPFVCGDELAAFEGNARAVVTGERTALNFLQRLCGIATLTHRFKDAVKGLNVRICDTRKTTPLLRRLEKQAVLDGGGSNHRYALFDGVLIKENHITATGGVGEAIRKAREGVHHLMKIGVEVTSLDEFDEAMAAGADCIMLDNMPLEKVREAVNRAQGRDVTLEASGNVTLERVRQIAETGVHIISVGALTHSAQALDLSLRIRNVHV